MKVQFNDKTSIDNRPDLSDAEKITGPNINEIKNVVNTNAEEFEAIKETVENNNTDITTLKNDNNKNKTDIKNLQADNTTNKKSIEELKQKNAEQDESIKTNASEIENLKQENIEIKAENERLRDDIKSIALVGEESGESIDLEDSSEARFNKFEIGGNHKQETRKGYNLLNMSKAKGGTSNGITCEINADGSVKYMGTATSNAINVFFLGAYGENAATLFTLKPGTYYIKDVILFNNTQSINSKKDQFFWTINEETNITSVRAVQAEIGKTYNEIKYPIVALSNKEVKWEPYGAMPSLEFPSEIKTVKDNINEVICNKNLLNQYKIVPYYIDGENKVQRWEGEVESLYIQIKSNTAYTVSKKISARFTIATSTEVPRVGLTVNAVSNRQANKLTITSKNEDKYLMIFYYKKTDDTLSSQEIISSIQVEEGTVATAYVKHQSQSIAMPVQQEMLKDDYFDFENEKQTNLFEKIIVDGDKIRANSIRDTSDGNFQWSFSIATKVDKLRKIYSNVAMQSTNFDKLNRVVLSKNSNNVYIKSNKDIFGDKEFSISNLNEILKKMYDTGNQVVFYIEKASDTELNFTDEQKVVAKKIKETLHTYKNITHIYSEDEVSPILNIEYAKDLNTVINNIQAQIINNASEEVSG